MPTRHKYIERLAGPPPVFRLAFNLPSQAAVEIGRHRPNPEGCAIEIDASGLAVITGPSRADVVEHARRFLRQISKGRVGPVIIPGARMDGAERCTIVIGTGGEVTFSPTAA